ncbi:MAG: helix-turn-helix domain-containing protein [Solirubrobacteraceae bacterium]
MYALARSDLRAVLDGAYDLLGPSDPAELPGAMLDVVGRLVGSDLASYNEIDIAHRTARVVIAGGPPPDCDQAAVFARHALENPLVAHQSITRDASARRLSDFISIRELHRRPIYGLIYRSLGVETQLAFGLPQPGTDVVGFALSRRRSDFSERDVAVLDTLSPLLAQIRASLRARAPEPAPVLTPRQCEVMSLLSDGATNHQIARGLGISEKTVAKHLEQVFRRLEVTNRTAAVAAWRRCHMRDSAY